MQAAPPVELALAAGRLERGVIAALHALAACVTAVWLLRWQLDQGEGGPAAVTGLDHWAWLLPALAGLAGLCAGHAVARRLLPPDAAASRLRWTGRHWALAGNGACEEAVVLDPLDLQIDAGAWVLLHARAASRVHTQALARGVTPPSSAWLVLRRENTPSSAMPWHAMRVALQAHAGVRLSADAPDRAPDPRPDVIHPTGRP